MISPSLSILVRMATIAQLRPLSNTLVPIVDGHYLRVLKAIAGGGGGGSGGGYW